MFITEVHQTPAWGQLFSQERINIITSIDSQDVIGNGPTSCSRKAAAATRCHDRNSAFDVSRTMIRK